MSHTIRVGHELHEQSKFKENCGLQQARENGYRGRLCNYGAACSMQHRCTFLHFKDEAASTPYMTSGERLGGRGNGAISKSIDDDNGAIVDDLAVLVEDRETFNREEFAKQLTDEKVKAVGSMLRRSDGRAPTILVASHVLQFVFCTGEDNKNRFEKVSGGLHRDALKWFKGAKVEWFSRPYNHEPLEGILHTLLRIEAGPLGHIFIDNAKKLRISISPEKQNADVWACFDNRCC